MHANGQSRIHEAAPFGQYCTIHHILLLLWRVFRQLVFHSDFQIWLGGAEHGTSNRAGVIGSVNFTGAATAAGHHQRSVVVFGSILVVGHVF